MTQSPAGLISVADTSALARDVLDEVEKAVVGKRLPLTLVLAAVLAKGHVLLEDFPGLGKTLAARSLARVLGLDFARVQFTPDLLPADITGSFLYNQRDGSFEFRRGPLFTGLLLADEINRTPPKTQSALLEAMQERQATVEGETFRLADPFHVLATANPIEYEGTYPLPEAQLDRFLMRVSFGYPSADEEYDVVQRRLERQKEEVDLAQVTDSAGLRASRATASSWPRPPVTTRTCSPGRRRAARSGWRSPHAASRSCVAATTSSPRTSRRWPGPCSRTGSPSSPSCG
jgi:MoxR-like ATPase